MHELIDFIIVAVYILFFWGWVSFQGKYGFQGLFFGRSMGFPLAFLPWLHSFQQSVLFRHQHLGLKLNGGMKRLYLRVCGTLGYDWDYALVIPPLFRSGVVSIYEFVERRFSASTRLILSIVFQISRVLGTVSWSFAIALILQAVLILNTFGRFWLLGSLR